MPIVGLRGLSTKRNRLRLLLTFADTGSNVTARKQEIDTVVLLHHALQRSQLFLYFTCAFLLYMMRLKMDTLA
jgi:hypothetical protein